MPTLSWSTLNILAWLFGLKAAYDLRTEFGFGARSWLLLTWAVGSCLLMELAMVGTPFVPGLTLFSAVTGISAGILLGAAFLALRREADGGPVRPARGWDRRFAGGYGAAAIASVVLAGALPSLAPRLAAPLNAAEGATWLVVSAALAATILAHPVSGTNSAFRMPRALGIAFLFAFAGAAFPPITQLAGWRAEPAIGHLFSTLFILALVTTLYSMLLHVRSEKLVSALTELHGAREQLFGVQKLVAVGTLAAGAAHDFNNTLTTILGHADLALGDRSLSPSVREDMQAIRQAAIGAATLTDNLLGIARKQGGRSGPTDLADAVRAPLDSLAREFDRQHIRVVTRLEPVPSPPGDLSLLYQVFLNLYLNARDAMIPKGGGVLSVSLRAAGPAVEVAVSDTGGGHPRGVPLAHLPAPPDDQGHRRNRPRPLGLEVGGRIAGRPHPL
jgi:signal transduction histidine kinase